MTKSRKQIDHDVLIIGGGAAGLSAALWCRDLKLSAALIEQRSELGGQLLSIHNPITNYLGRRANNGREMRSHFLSQLDGVEGIARLNSAVVAFDPKSISAQLADGNIVTGRAAILSTGVRRRRLAVPGETELIGRGILESGVRDRELVQGKAVAIIGGGDAALENALILAEKAKAVYVVHRRNDLSARSEFVRRARVDPKIRFLFQSTVTRFIGNEQLYGVELSGPEGESVIDVDAALVRIGVQPHTELFAGKIELDHSGYIIVDNLGATSAPNIFAAGDVANGSSPTISTAVGMAATAVKVIYSLIYGDIDL